MSLSFARRVRTSLVLTAALAIATSCGGGGGGGGGSPAGTGGTGLVDGASVVPSPIFAAQTSFPGEFAADFIRRVRFTKLIVEIDYAAGHAPAASVLTLLQTRIQDRCDKPGGVTVVLDDSIPLSEFKATPQNVTDIEALENAHRDNFANSNTQTEVLYILFVKGTSDIAGGGAGSQVLAITYHGSSVALFTDVAESNNSAAQTTAEVEGAALVHEAGHALGLVNGGCPMVMQHEDTTHAGHDVSSASVMYWQIKIPFVSPNIGDPTFALFGNNCELDIAAAGGLPASPFPAHILPASLEPVMIPIGQCGTCLLAEQRAAAAAVAAGAGGAHACPSAR